MPPVTLADRHSLGVIALGDKCPPLAFFAGLQETTIPDNEHLQAEPTAGQVAVNDQPEPLSSISDIANVDKQADGELQQAKQQLTSQLQRLSGLLTSSQATIAALGTATSSLSKISTESQLVQLLMSSSHHRCRIIRGQPTAIARRRPGVTRGCKRIAAGRPPLAPAAKRAKKRPRNLALSIARNVANAKSHGH